MAQAKRPFRFFAVGWLAVCFGLLSTHDGFSIRFLGFAIASFLLIVLADIDWHSHLLPDALTYPLLGLGLAWAWAGASVPLAVAVGGAVAGFAFLYVCATVFKRLGGREAVGRGDMKLLAALGAWLGAGPLVWVLALACVVGVVAAMWRQRTVRPHGDYPFGPFLAGAALVAFCLVPWIR